MELPEGVIDLLTDIRNYLQVGRGGTGIQAGLRASALSAKSPPAKGPPPPPPRSSLDPAPGRTSVSHPSTCPTAAS